METHIADSYVSDEDIKIEIHNLISNIDSFTSFENIKKSLPIDLVNYQKIYLFICMKNYLKKLQKN